MNIIPQMNLFGEDEFEDLGDLERLQMVLSSPELHERAQWEKARGQARGA